MRKLIIFLFTILSSLSSFANLALQPVFKIENHYDEPVVITSISNPNAVPGLNGFPIIGVGDSRSSPYISGKLDTNKEIYIGLMNGQDKTKVVYFGVFQDPNNPEALIIHGYLGKGIAYDFFPGTNAVVLCTPEAFQKNNRCPVVSR